jgi:Ca-activated chloride channel family protein
MSNIQFAHPAYFYMLLLIPAALIWYIFRHNKVQGDLQIPEISPFAKISKGPRVIFRHVPFILRMFIFTLLIVILARPQSTNKWENETIEGIDIMLVLDVSNSMLAGDFSPNRIEASKDVANDFVLGRNNDRIGLVLFGGESFTQCPLTTDHAVLLNLLHDVNVGMIEDESTAIGLGLANAVKRLKDSNARSRVIILVTDGQNNAGSIDPLTAGEIAKTFGIRVYTIGVGTNGMAPYPVRNVFGDLVYTQIKVDIDEPMLRQIAAMTKGEYFRATNNQKLKEIYSRIDKLEKTKIDVKKYARKHEEYQRFAIACLILVILEILLRNTVLRTIM